MNVHYDTLPAMKRMTGLGLDQTLSEGVVSEIFIATKDLVTADYLRREMELQTEKLGNRIFQAVIGSAGLIVIAQIVLKSVGLT